MTKVGIIGEDYSDIDTLRVFIQRIRNRPFKLRKYAAQGCARLKKKCSRIARQWVRENTIYIIICHDLDCADERKCRLLMEELLGYVSEIPERDRVVCIVIPIEELEAWFLADIDTLNRKFSGMNLGEIHNPERVTSPKEFIQKKSRDRKSKPRYINTIHNPELARDVNIENIFDKCPAFRPFHDFVLALP